MNKYSQNDEDEVIAYLLSRVEHPYSKFFFEVGADEPGGVIQCNTALLAEQGWDGVMLDERRTSHPRSRQERVTAENLPGLLEKYGVPRDLGVLSIDVDGMDYWLWKAVPREYRPAITIVECNQSLPPWGFKVMPYDPEFRWDGRSAYFGGSLSAMVQLGRTKGLVLAAMTYHCNLFFMQQEDLSGTDEMKNRRYVVDPDLCEET